MTFRRSLLTPFLLSLGLLVGMRAQSDPTVTQSIGNRSLNGATPTTAIDLREHFTLNGVSGPIAHFRTVLGNFNVELLPGAAPQHVTNFQAYANAAAYNDTIIHRSATFDNSTPSIVQGGGFKAAIPPYAFNKNAPVPLEYNLPNARGTLAAARTSAPNSATSEWYFNVKDNSTILGPANGGGYTVFGRVLGNGMSVVDAIAAQARWDARNAFSSAAFGEIPLVNYQGGAVQLSHLVIIQSVTMIPLYPTGSGNAALTFAAESSNPNVATVSLSGSTLTVTRGNASGTANIQVTASDLHGTVVQSSFAVTVQNAPTIVEHPASQTVAPGGGVTFSVAEQASGTVTYQWAKDGSAITGATSSSLSLTSLSANDSGDYTVTVTSAGGSATSRPATLLVAPPVPGGLLNLSARARATTGSGTLIAGFVTQGAGTLPVTIRVAGPALAEYLDGELADPTVVLLEDQTTIASNDDWTTDLSLGGLGFTPGSADAVLNQALDAGNYTAQAVTKNGASGVALIELYDTSSRVGGVDGTAARLINISARAQVGTGDDVLIAGFVIDGNVPKRILVRGVGPGLLPYGVQGVLEDPQLVLFRGQTVVAENDDWTGSDGESGFDLEAGSKDAVLTVTLTPGSYTAQVRGANGTTGVALVEVYELP